MNKQNFVIKSEKFEGPLDLLLELIEKNKLSINDISLCAITKKFIDYVRENELKLKQSSFFIATAATLMLLKSRSLLPKLALDKNEEEDIGELKKRLKYLVEIKKRAEVVKEMFAKSILFSRVYRKKVDIKFRPDESITLKNILGSLDGLTKRSDFIKEVPERKVSVQLSLKEVISNINKKIKTHLKISFREVSIGQNKKDLSVSFLAILELFRNGEIDLRQENAFGTIEIESSK